MLNFRDGFLKISQQEMEDLGWIDSQNNAWIPNLTSKIIFEGVKDVVDFPFEKFRHLYGVQVDSSAEVFDVACLAGCEKLHIIEIAGDKNLMGFNPRLKIVGELPKQVAEKLVIPCWLDVVRYRPDFFFDIPEKRFQNEYFVRHCLNRCLWGMKQRSKEIADYANSEERKNDVELYRQMRARIKEELGIDMVGEVKDYTKVENASENIQKNNIKNL